MYSYMMAMQTLAVWRRAKCICWGGNTNKASLKHLMTGMLIAHLQNTDQHTMDLAIGYATRSLFTMTKGFVCCR